MPRWGRALSARLKGNVQHQSEGLALVSEPGDVALVHRGQLRSLVMKCPDGCGESITVNLDPRAGPAWRLYEDDGRITLFPSVWRESGCRAHFVLWDDAIYWSGLDSIARQITPDLSAEVLAALGSGFTPYTQIAESLHEIPWTVLIVCRRLARAGQIEEGAESEEGQFRKLPVQRSHPPR